MNMNKHEVAISCMMLNFKYSQLIECKNIHIIVWTRNGCELYMSVMHMAAIDFGLDECYLA